MLGSTFEDCQVGAAESPGRSAQPWRLRLNGEVVHNGKLAGKTGSLPRERLIHLLSTNIVFLLYFTPPFFCFAY